MRGGGIAGPRGEVARLRAGDPGEYHHSRNLTKKMAVGNRNRNESSRSRGELFSNALIFEDSWRFRGVWFALLTTFYDDVLANVGAG
jgi:hypothetical protein